jgi:pimeloyl-ACP methyl ester carboxylesterase
VERLKTSKQFLVDFTIIAATIFVGLPSFSATLSCEQSFNSDAVNWNTSFYSRGQELTPVRYDDDKSYLAEIQRAQTFGKVQSYFDAKLDTRIYFSATALPNRIGRISTIDPDAKAIFVFFHGSGTMQSSGKNFVGLMNTLASMGYSSISMDMPYHAEGPIRDQFKSANYFMNWVHQIVAIATTTGKPVYLAGHSFGPDVIAEYLYRYPFDVQGAALLSPAGFTKRLEWWQTHETEKMKFGGDVPSNRLAGEWADTMSKQFGWTKRDRSDDPTVRNPFLYVRHLSGDREEYAEAPLGGKSRLPIGPNTYSIGNALQNFFQNMVSTTEPGVGHYIFSHVDSLGQPIVLRELLALVGESALNEKALRTGYSDSVAKSRTEADNFLFQYATDRIFQAWVNENYSAKIFDNIFRNRDSKMARKIVVDYVEAKRAREKNLNLK